jgi:hypothetical protein
MRPLKYAGGVIIFMVTIGSDTLVTSCSSGNSDGE